MTNKILLKIKSNSGESIAETLVAVLIAAVGLLMLAGTINTASNLITKSQNTLNTYYKANNRIETRTTGDKVTKAEGTDGSLLVETLSSETLSSETIKVTLYDNAALSKHVLAYDLEPQSEASAGEVTDSDEG